MRTWYSRTRALGCHRRTGGRARPHTRAWRSGPWKRSGGINVHYSAVRNVADRYRVARRAAGGDPDTDGPEELHHSQRRRRGSCGSRQHRQRTSTNKGILKAEPVSRIAVILADRASTPADVRSATDERLAALREAWVPVPGLRSGLSYDAFLLTLGLGTVKGDRMVRRFVTDAIGLPVSSR